MPKSGSAGDATVTIKKYTNRRLYDTAASRYVTLSHLADMIRDGRDIVVVEAASGADITREVLTQIIFAEESQGERHLLPVDFLRQLIRVYGDPLQSAVPAYLTTSMKTLTRHRDRVRRVLEAADPSGFEDMARRNLALLEEAFDMTLPAEEPAGPDRTELRSRDEDKPAHEQIDTLKRQLDVMQEQLDRLAAKRQDAE